MQKEWDDQINDVHVIAGSPPGTGTQEATAPVAANPSDAVLGDETQTDIPTYRDAAAAPAAPPAPLTSDERLLRLLQVHWPASPFRNIRLFNTSIVLIGKAPVPRISLKFRQPTSLFVALPPVFGAK